MRSNPAIAASDKKSAQAKLQEQAEALIGNLTKLSDDLAFVILQR